MTAVAMTDNEHKEKGEARDGRGLSIREEQGNLLSQALHGLSEEQHSELMLKAAEEALGVHKDAAQREVKSNAAFRDVNEHVDTVNQLDSHRSLSHHRVKSEIETGSGKMTIDSRKGPSCFVATAVFNDPNATEVICLRHFRDTVLVRYGAGQRFISWYYRNGPRIAAWIQDRPRTKQVTKALLETLVKLLSKTTHS